MLDPRVQTVEKTVEISQLQIVEIPEIQTVQGTQTSQSLGTALVRQVTLAEIVEVVEIAAPLPAESAQPLFVTAPVLLSLAVVVEQEHPLQL